MLRALLVSLVVLIPLGVLERTFLPALAGGVWPADLVLAAAAVRLTSFSPRGAVVWVAVAAAVSEAFATGPFGAAAVGVICGLVTARLLLFYLLSHRSAASRAICAVAGVSAGVIVATAIRSAFSIFDGAVESALFAEMADGAVRSVLSTAIFAGSASLALSAIGSRAADVFRKRKPAGYAIP